jgi:REP element-mobilizing transposase RayT
MADDSQTLNIFRERLPHWLVPEHPYFITLCRKGCVPAPLLAGLASAPGDPAAGDAWAARFDAADALLNAAGTKPRDLTTPAIAQGLFDSFDWLRGKGWRLWAGCIMPSHLHLVMRNDKGRNDQLTEDLGLFKSYTERAANRLRGAEGAFWQPECVDHWCRDGEDWLGYVRRTALNPVLAGLVKTRQAWRWTVVDPELITLL